MKLRHTQEQLEREREKAKWQINHLSGRDQMSNLQNMS